MAVVLAAGSFSCANTNKETAEPPTLVGETAELNSQIKINCMIYKFSMSTYINCIESCQLIKI